jgi:hypothetical protein
VSIGVNNGYYGSGTTDTYGTATGTNPGGTFVPQVWSGKLAVKFYIATCLTEITNNDWEGEIQEYGDKVVIRSIPTITINNYTKGATLTGQVPEAGTIVLSIDQGKYFAVVLDDVDAVQSDIRLMDIFSSDAAEQMKIAVEYDVFSSVYSQAAAFETGNVAGSSGNQGLTAGAKTGSVNLGAVGTPLAINNSNVLDTIVYAGQVLDEQNVPETGRWMVITPWIAAMIKRSDLREVYLTGDDVTPLRNGKLGMIDRFTLYVSNNLYQGTDTYNSATVNCYELLAGTRDAISFASQVTKVESVRSTTTFGDILRGLNIFGFKVTKPEALVWIHCVHG